MNALRARPLVSVVIPNFNYGRYLGQAIESALGQSYPAVEVLVVDDGSTDQSRDVLGRYEGRIRVICQPRQGVSSARNRGVLESRGELVAFLDSDDLWHPQKLERQVALMDRPAVGIVCCGLRYIDHAGRPVRDSIPRQRGPLLRDIALLRWTYAPGGSAALVRRACFGRVGLFDPALSTSADWDLWRRIACHYEFEAVQEPLVDYRQHPGSMRTDLGALERDMLRAFANMFADPAAVSLRPIRRRCYSNLYRMLSGSYIHAGRWSKGLGYGWRSLVAWPPNALAEAAALRRRLIPPPVCPPPGSEMMGRMRNRTVRAAGSTVDSPIYGPPSAGRAQVGGRDGPVRALYLSHDGLLEPLGQSQILPYVRRLAARGAAITVLSFEKSSDRRHPERLQRLQRRLADDGIQWVPLTYHARPRLLATAWDMLRGLVHGRRLVLSRDIELIHARSYVPALIGWFLKRWVGVRLLFDMRGFWADERREGGGWSPTGWLYRAVKRLERLLLLEADEVITLTHAARRTIEERFGGRAPRITVIPTCVDLDRFSMAPGPRDPGRSPVLVYAGSIADWYLPEALLQFSAQVLRRFPEARVLLLTRHVDAARRAVDRSRLPHGAVRIISADPAEIPHHLATAHAGLAFYRPGFSRRGTCPTKIGEYLAMGLPAVVNAGIGDVEELIEAGRVGAVVREFSPEAYERALDELERLWADPTLAERCRRVAEHSFSLQMGIERYWASYERLARAPAQSPAAEPAEVCA